ncbi:MAG: hypothetical protein JST93_24640 [Acidobacteria bacterium]|nr:hypothetical protein [Acidobacteriota bacterium]
MSGELWRQAASRKADCPSVEEWASYMEQSAKRPEMEAHREGCAACQAEVAMLRSFLEAEAAPEEAADLAYVMGKLRKEESEAWWRRLFAPSSFKVWAFAAVALVVVAIGVQYRAGMPPVGQEVGGEMRSGLVVEGLTPSGDVAQAPAQFEWKAVAGATGYQLQIMTVDGAEVWRSAVGNRLYCKELPGPDVFSVRKTLLVRVTAFGPEGKQLAVSPDIRLRVMP